jgi:hypothetical protein
MIEAIIEFILNIFLFHVGALVIRFLSAGKIIVKPDTKYVFFVIFIGILSVALAAVAIFFIARQ